MKTKNVLTYLFPLCLLSFSAIAVKYWDLIFDATVRWVLTGLLFATLMATTRLPLAFKTWFGPLFGLYLAWCVATTMWSELPLLSLLKSSAFVMVATSLVSAGYVWSVALKEHDLLDYLLPIVVLTLFAALFDQGANYRSALGDTVELQLYQGATGNPNNFGVLIAMSFPYAVWRAYRSQRSWISRTASLALVAGLLLLIWLSASRASLLCILATAAGFIIALDLGKKVLLGGLAGLAVIGLVVAAPAAEDAFYTRLVIKGNLRADGGILFSRQQLWMESYTQAVRGGALGGGYGVTIGDDSFASINSLVSSEGYGREKGSTPLAVWEETGLVGLGLYVVLILQIVWGLWTRLPKIRDARARVEVGLLMGVVLGFIMHSLFEAWWSAPGSPEASYFWAALGVAAGAVQRALTRQRLSLLSIGSESAVVPDAATVPGGA